MLRDVLGGCPKRGYLKVDSVAMVLAKLVRGILDVTNVRGRSGTHDDNGASCSNLRWYW